MAADCAESGPEHYWNVWRTVLAVALLSAPGCSSADLVVPSSTRAAPGPYYDVTMAVAVLTQPDAGPQGRTLRWAGPAVSYRVRLPGYPRSFMRVIDEAFAWSGRRTGLAVAKATGPAQIEVVPKTGNGARVAASVTDAGEITHVQLELGCCRPRAAWEDVLQAFGPLGDRADSRSVFSQDHGRQLPSAFDAWVLRALYSIPPGNHPLLAARALELLAGEQDP